MLVSFPDPPCKAESRSGVQCHFLSRGWDHMVSFLDHAWSWVSDASVHIDYYTARLTKAWNGHKVNWDSRKQAVSLLDRLWHSRSVLWFEVSNPTVHGPPLHVTKKRCSHHQESGNFLSPAGNKASTELCLQYGRAWPKYIVMRGHKRGLRLLGKANLKDALEHWK